MHVRTDGVAVLDWAGTAAYAATHYPPALRAATLRLLASNACFRNLRTVIWVVGTTSRQLSTQPSHNIAFVPGMNVQQHDNAARMSRKTHLTAVGVTSMSSSAPT